MDVGAAFGRALGQPPDHCVVADDAAGGMIHPAEDGVPGPVGDVQGRDQFLALLGIEELALDAVELGRGHVEAHGLEGGFAVGQVEVAAVVEHQVEVEFPGQDRPEVEGLLVERDVLLGPLVGPDDGGVPSRAAETDVVLLDDGHVGDAVVPGQEIGGGQPVQSAADDDRIVCGFHGRPGPESLRFSEHGMSLLFAGGRATVRQHLDADTALVHRPFSGPS